ncbi:MAG: hypothetical protein K0R57_2067 [Paenibacillaceae bacterium]|nr:hypothetical protein [Paenibacillaceae bacterium]
MERFGVNILWTARYDYEKGRRLAPHAHSFYQVIWIAEGKGRFRYNEEVFEASPGSLFWIAPEQLHGLEPYRGTSIKTLDLKFEIISTALEQLASRLPAWIDHAGPEAAHLLDSIRREGAGREAHYREVASLHLAELIYRLARTAADTASGSASVASSARENGLPALAPGYFSVPTEGAYTAAQQAERWIEDHAEEEWTVSEMALQLKYSESYLRQLFKTYKGCTIPAYQKQVRIQRSKERMTYSDCSLKQIAEACGFKTIQHFGRVFKQLEGITPGQWLDREKRGIRKDILFGE